MGAHTNPFNLIFDKIIKFIDDVTNLNNFRKCWLSLDKHFQGDTAGLALKMLYINFFICWHIFSPHDHVTAFIFLFSLKC